MLAKLKNIRKAFKDACNLRVEEIAFRLKGNNKIIFGDKKLISFSSNDYLNLSSDRRLIKAGVKALKKYGASASSSKFIEGYHFFYDKIKEKMKVFKNAEDCLIFSTGYMTNLAIFEALAEGGDVVFLDEYSHASTFAGVKLSGARPVRFAHNNFQDLEEKLSKYASKDREGKIFIATETIFSMQGSALFEPWKYVEIAKKYDAILITDEAHSFGIAEFNFPEYNLHLKMGTFSKAVGVFGGYVCGGLEVIESIRQFGKAGIYTTALPPSILASILASLEILAKKPKIKALENAKFFAKLMGMKAESQIIFLELESSAIAIEASKKLQDGGFFVKAIRPPTVKKAGIRVSFNNLHKTLDIKKLSFIIKHL